MSFLSEKRRNSSCYIAYCQRESGVNQGILPHKENKSIIIWRHKVKYKKLILFLNLLGLAAWFMLLEFKYFIYLILFIMMIFVKISLNTVKLKPWENCMLAQKNPIGYLVVGKKTKEKHLNSFNNCYWDTKIKLYFYKAYRSSLTCSWVVSK